MPSMTIFNGRGDLTIAWDEADDEAVTAMIEKKMAEGYTFFILEPRLGGMAAPAKIPLKRVSDALHQRAVALRLSDGDREIAGLIESGKAEPVATPSAIRTKRKATSAKEAAASETVGVRPKRGG